MPIKKLTKAERKKPVAHYFERERMFKLPKGVGYDANFLPIIQNLSALGYPAADIGMILGYAGKDARQFIKNLSKNYSDMAEAIKIGNSMANSYLVAQMFKSAVGYDYDEEDFKYTHNEDGTVKNKIQTGGKTKHYSGSPQLAMFVAANRMPESFVNRLEIHKKNFDLFKEVPKDTIKRLAGKLLEYADHRKKVESKEIKETEDDRLQTQ